MVGGQASCVVRSEQAPHSRLCRLGGHQKAGGRSLLAKACPGTACPFPGLLSSVQVLQGSGVLWAPAHVGHAPNRRVRHQPGQHWYAQDSCQDSSQVMEESKDLPAWVGLWSSPPVGRNPSGQTALWIPGGHGSRIVGRVGAARASLGVEETGTT